MHPQRPAPIRTDASNRFAHHTMRVRIPGILRDLQARSPHFSPVIHGAIERLHDEILGDRPLTPLTLPAIDASAWSRALTDREGQGWLSTDWFFAEAFFYRCVLQATRYWETGLDPFLPHKLDELASPAPFRSLDQALSLRSRPLPERMVALCRASLWGNRADLSYAAAASRGTDPGADDLIVDQIAEAVAPLLASPGEVHILLDNAGTELLLDLALVDALLDLAPRVLLHAKMTPTFVSDVTPADFHLTLARLAARERSADARALAARLQKAFDEGRLGSYPGLYWNSHRFFFDMPPLLRRCLASAGLVISKGDANYRRFTGDALWPTTTPFARVTSFFPAPLLALRTLKSDTIVGLPERRDLQLAQLEPEWRSCGRFGVAQYAPPAPAPR